MKSYKNSCTNSILNYDLISQFKFNTKSIIPIVSEWFLQNTRSQIAEQWCSAEHVLGKCRITYSITKAMFLAGRIRCQNLNTVILPI